MYPIVILIKKSSIFFVFYHGTITTFQLQIKKYHRVGFAIKKLFTSFKKTLKIHYFTYAIIIYLSDDVFFVITITLKLLFMIVINLFNMHGKQNYTHFMYYF